jgi:hypothetical protein
MPRPLAVCRACGAPDQTATYRECHCVVLCAECNVDWDHGLDHEEDGSPPDVRVVHPEPRPYNPPAFTIICGGGGR